jgi:hypothetical protein
MDILKDMFPGIPDKISGLGEMACNLLKPRSMIVLV